MLAKYLGVILDSRLTWKKHVDIKVRTAHCLLWVCSRAYGETWGLRPRVTYWLYVCIIRPSITVASLVWWPGCQAGSAKKKLCRVQTCTPRDNGSDVHYPHEAVEAFLCLPNWS